MINNMKTFILMGCIAAILVSCNYNKPWEYKVVKVAGKEAEYRVKDSHVPVDNEIIGRTERMAVQVCSNLL